MKPIAKIHSDGYWTSLPGFKEPLNFSNMDVYAASEVKALIQAILDECEDEDKFGNGFTTTARIREIIGELK